MKEEMRFGLVLVLLFLGWEIANGDQSSHCGAMQEDAAKSCRSLRSLAHHRQILLSISNVGNLELWKNWAMGAKRSGVDNFATFAVDEEIVTHVEGTWLEDHLIRLPPHVNERLQEKLDKDALESFSDFKTGAYTLMMKLVPEMIRWVVEDVGLSVLYTDTDVVVLSNPFDAIRNLPTEHDWYVSIDGTEKKKEETRCTYRRACGGLMYITPSPTASTILADWNSGVWKKSQKANGNQPAYNKAIDRYVNFFMRKSLYDETVVKKLRSSRVGFLPCELFPNGNRFNELFSGDWWRPLVNTRPVMVHNNWIIGKENKIATFKRWNLWYPDIPEGEFDFPLHLDETIAAATATMSMIDKFKYRHNPT